MNTAIYQISSRHLKTELRMKVAIFILSLMVLAVASVSIDETMENFGVQEVERKCGDINDACKSDCDCCGERGSCDCYWSKTCKCREGTFLTAWYKLIAC